MCCAAAQTGSAARRRLTVPLPAARWPRYQLTWELQGSGQSRLRTEKSQRKTHTPALRKAMREFFSWFTSGVLSDENGPGQPILPHGSIYQLGVRGVKISSQVSVRGRRFQRFLVARMSAQPGKERCPKFFDVDWGVGVTGVPARRGGNVRVNRQNQHQERRT